MKHIKFVAIVSILFVGLSSSVSASWWNPTTWRIFKKESKTIVQQKTETENVISVSTTTFEKLTENSYLSCNGSKYKKCPEGQVFTCPTNGDEAFCEKDKSNEIKTPKIKEPTVKDVVIKKTNVNNVVKKEIKADTENYNTLIISTADSIIRNYERYIAHFEKLNEIFSDREAESLAIARRINSGLNPATGIQNDILILLAESKNDDASYVKSLRIANENNIAILKNMLSQLKQYREQKVGMYYIKDDAVKEAKELMPLYDKLDPYMDSSSKFLEYFTSYTQKNDEMYSSTITSLKNQNIADRNYLDSQRRAISQSAPVFQAVIPKIELPQMPKTTYCNTSYTGIHGNYNITCTER